MPIEIAFGDEANNPWTEGTWRYRFYNQPVIEMATPGEVRIGRFEEIYLTPYEGDKFFERKYYQPLTSTFISNHTFFLFSFAIWKNRRHHRYSVQL